MGNCQAADAAAVVIQHPGGKVDRLYWSTTADEVMRTNPGHYVALVILRMPAPDKAAGDAAAGAGGGAKITRVKLLKPKDTLLVGQVYRLITSQEVAKALRARKEEKMQRCESIRQQHEQLRLGEPVEEGSSNQDGKREKDRHRGAGAGAGSGAVAGAGRGRHWRPALQSISEAASQSGISESATS